MKLQVLLLLPLLWIFLCGQCGCRRNAPKVINERKKKVFFLSQRLIIFTLFKEFLIFDV